METHEEIDAFRDWCCTHPVKAVRDWYENKVRHQWYLPSLNQHLSRMPRDHWALTPKNTNFGESAHAHTNLHTEIGLTLLVAIKVAYKYNLECEEEMLLAKNCLLHNSRNMVSHCMQHNAILATGQAQAADDHATEAEEVRELESLRDRLAAELESCHAPSGLTTEECKASWERSKILEAQVELLRSEGVTLHCGRKPKHTSMASTQPPASSVAMQNAIAPPSTAHALTQ
ncbi:hypothetical protein K439DRAFT_1613391 [Ramaria rubella]|nr:hypothetical protein K439DRAFT_1613391 [Ramaria rubella]